jgi:hypothetical protein
MKKLFALTSASIVLASAAFASIGNLQALNAEIATILAPFQNENTVARLSFLTIETNEERALAVSVNGLYSKTGTQNPFAIRLGELAYTYGDGSAPTARLNASVAIDLTKIISQESINQLIPIVESVVQDMSKDVTRKYGNAATVDFRVLEKTQDEAGNYVSIKALLKGQIDLGKLPETMPVDSVLLQSGEAVVTVNVKEGISLEGVMVINPRYKGFQRDQKGLKETLEQLLARDPQQMEEIRKIFAQIDGFANKFAAGQLR